jgi:hypothetical protein
MIAMATPRLWCVLLTTILCAATLCSCSQRVARPSVPEPDDVPLDFPTEALSPDAIRPWWQERADPREGSLDLDGPVVSVESRVRDSNGDFDGVGFFVDRTRWHVEAVLLFLVDNAPTRRALEPTGERLCGRPLYTTETPATFVVGSEACVQAACSKRPWRDRSPCRHSARNTTAPTCSSVADAAARCA